MKKIKQNNPFRVIYFAINDPFLIAHWLSTASPVWTIDFCGVSWTQWWIWVFFFPPSDPSFDHSRWVAVGAAGHTEDRLIHQQQRRGEIQTAGERKPRAAEDHSRGTCCLSHCWSFINCQIDEHINAHTYTLRGGMNYWNDIILVLVFDLLETWLHFHMSFMCLWQNEEIYTCWSDNKGLLKAR